MKCINIKKGYEVLKSKGKKYKKNGEIKLKYKG